MEVSLFLPYYDYNDGAFDVNNDYYNGEEYINAVSTEYNKNKDIVYSSMEDFKNGSQSVFMGGDGQTYKFGQKTSQNEDKVAFSRCDGVLYDDSGEDETIDGFIDKFAKQKSFVEMVEFDRDTSEEEFETEISLWSKEHLNINQYKDKLGDEWVWVKEPKRNVKVRFKNHSDEEITAILENCKIMDIIEGNIFILYIEKITLINE